MSAVLAILLTTAAVLVPGIASGQDDPAEPVPAEVEAAQQVPWSPPDAGHDGFTWVRLATGEWLKGEIKDLRDGTLQFDSDELGDLTYDWDDVTALISSEQHTLTTWERESFTGFIVARRDRIRVLDGDGQELCSVTPDDVSSLIEGEPHELNFWSGLLSAGSTVRSGNSDQKDASILVRLNRRALVSRWDNTLNFSYAEAGGSKNQETRRVTSRYDWFLSPNLFVTAMDYEYYRDPFQNVAERHTPGAALGYDRSFGPASWDLTAGTAWQYTRYGSVPDGEDRILRKWVGRVTTGLEWDITADLEFDVDYAINFPFEDANRYTSNLLGVFSLDLWWNLEIDLTLAWDRQNQPQTAEDGSRPKKDDYRLTTAIGWDF